MGALYCDEVDCGGGERRLLRLRVFLAFSIIGVIGIAASLISGFQGNQFRLPGEPEIDPRQRMSKREAIRITAAALFPLVAMIILAAIFWR